MHELSVRIDMDLKKHTERTINVWNILSTDCVNVSSMNTFKRERTDTVCQGRRCS